MQLTKEWLQKWEEVKKKLKPRDNIEDYFILISKKRWRLDKLDFI